MKTAPCHSMVTWYMNKGVHLVSNFPQKSYQLARRISSRKILNVTCRVSLIKGWGKVRHKSTAPVGKARLLEVSVQQTSSNKQQGFYLGLIRVKLKVPPPPPRNGLYLSYPDDDSGLRSVLGQVRYKYSEPLPAFDHSCKRPALVTSMVKPLLNY